jgi:serine/threonine protein kinase
MIFHKFPFAHESGDQLKQDIMNQPLKFRSSRKRITEDCKDLLRKLLNKEPEERIDLISARSHKWFQQPEETLNEKVKQAYKDFEEQK